MHFDRGRQPMTALRYYAEAAEAALLHFSPARAWALPNAHWPCCSRRREGRERDALEITLATLHGVSAFQLARRRAPRRRAPSSVPTRCWPMSRSIRCAGACCTGSAIVLGLRGDYARGAGGREAGRSALVGDERSGADAGRVHPCTARCIISRAARRRPAPGWSAGSRSPSRWTSRPNEIFAADPQVMLLGHAGHRTRSSRPGPAGPRARAAGACARGRAAPADDAAGRSLARRAARGAAGQPPSGSPPLADEMQALVDEFSLAQGQTACRWFRGWADARNGPTARGLSADPRGLRRNIAARDARRCQRGARAMPRKRCCSPATVDAARCAAAGSAADRRRAGRARVPAAAAAARGRDRPCPGEARGAARLRFGARSRRLERRKRPGWSCSRWSNCASTTKARRRKTAMHWRRWSTELPEAAGYRAGEARASAARRRRSRPDGRERCAVRGQPRARLARPLLPQLPGTGSARPARPPARPARARRSRRCSPSAPRRRAAASRRAPPWAAPACRRRAGPTQPSTSDSSAVVGAPCNASCSAIAATAA